MRSRGLTVLQVSTQGSLLLAMDFALFGRKHNTDYYFNLTSCHLIFNPLKSFLNESVGSYI